MAKLVNLPNGSQGSFPDEMSWEDIESVVQKQFPMEQPKDNRNLLQKAGGVAQKYINEPLEDIGRQAGEVSQGYLQGLANIGPGIYNLGAKAANLIPGVNIEEKKGFHFAPKTANAMLGELGSFFGPGMLGKVPEIAAIPKYIESIPQIANALNKVKGMIGKSPQAFQKSINVLSNIGKGAAQGAIYNPEDQGLSALLGGGGTALGMGLSAGVPFGLKKAGVLRGEPGRETLENINYEEIKPTIEAARRQGIDLTPAEAAESGYIGGQQGRYVRTSKGAIESERLSKERSKQETKSINAFLNKIYDNSASSDNKIKKLYDDVYRWNLKEPVVNKLRENTLISNAIEKVKGSPIWKDELKNVDENNVRFFDLVKRELGDTEQGLKNSRTGKDTGESLQYKKARKQLEQVLDSAAPGYKEARKEAAKKILRAELDKKLKREAIKGSEFYNSIIKNDFEYKKLFNKLKGNPEAQQHLEDFKLIFRDLIKTPKATDEAFRSSTSVNQARTNIEKLIQMWDSLFNKERNYESVKFTRNMDKWVSELQEARASGNKARTESVLSDIMIKAFAGGLNVTKEGLKE